LRSIFFSRSAEVSAWGTSLSGDSNRLLAFINYSQRRRFEFKSASQQKQHPAKKNRGTLPGPSGKALHAERNLRSYRKHQAGSSFDTAHKKSISWFEMKRLKPAEFAIMLVAAN